MNINNYTFYTIEDSKNELINILIETSRKVLNEIRKPNMEHTINLKTEFNYYKITYKSIPNGRKIENLLNIKRVWQSDINTNKTDRDLYLNIVNHLYWVRKKEYKSFKILKIEELEMIHIKTGIYKLIPLFR